MGFKMAGYLAILGSSICFRRCAFPCCFERNLWMDEILHHLRNPGMMIPRKIPTNHVFFFWFLRWCEISSIRSISPFFPGDYSRWRSTFRGQWVQRVGLSSTFHETVRERSGKVVCPQFCDSREACSPLFSNP